MQTHKPQTLFEIENGELPRPVELRPRMAPAPLQPTDEMRRAKAWIEAIQCPPEPDHELLATHGWLSPDGILYACGWKQHDKLTLALGFKHEAEIEEAGFCKLTQVRWLVEPRYCGTGLTDRQWQTIERWYERNGFPDEHFMRLGALV